MSHSDTRCARTAGPATTPPVLVGRSSRGEERPGCKYEYCQIPAAQHSVVEVPAVTPRPTAEVSSTRRSVHVLPAPPENPGQEAPVGGLAPGPAPGLASELAPAPELPALCALRTRVGERRSVRKVWTGLVSPDQSVPARELSNSTAPVFPLNISVFRRGYRGNALVACRRGECFNDSECSPDRACFDYKCKDPCKGPDTSCGANANCKVVNHGAVCSCPSGYQGNPLSSCVSSRRG